MINWLGFTVVLMVFYCITLGVITTTLVLLCKKEAFKDEQLRWTRTVLVLLVIAYLSWLTQSSGNLLSLVNGETLLLEIVQSTSGALANTCYGSSFGTFAFNYLNSADTLILLKQNANYFAITERRKRNKVILYILICNMVFSVVLMDITGLFFDFGDKSNLLHKVYWAARYEYVMGMWLYGAILVMSLYRIQ